MVAILTTLLSYTIVRILNLKRGEIDLTIFLAVNTLRVSETDQQTDQSF